jgi:hypothetical protein
VTRTALNCRSDSASSRARGFGVRCFILGVVLGSEGFVEKLKLLLADQAALKAIPRRECLAARPNLAELLADVSDKQARNQQIHEAVRVHEHTLKEVDGFLGPTTRRSKGLQSASMKRRNTKNKDLSLTPCFFLVRLRHFHPITPPQATLSVLC